MSKSTECSNLIVTEKENYQKKMAKKLDNPLQSPRPSAPPPQQKKNTCKYKPLRQKNILIFHRW